AGSRHAGGNVQRRGGDKRLGPGGRYQHAPTGGQPSRLPLRSGALPGPLTPLAKVLLSTQAHRGGGADPTMTTKASSPHKHVGDVAREALRARLGRGEALKLVMASSDWAFRAKHIPGSVHFKTPAEMFAALRPDEDIVVYCSNVDCHASLALIQKLRDQGY